MISLFLMCEHIYIYNPEIEEPIKKLISGVEDPFRLGDYSWLFLVARNSLIKRMLACLYF